MKKTELQRHEFSFRPDTSYEIRSTAREGGQEIFDSYLEHTKKKSSELANRFPLLIDDSNNLDHEELRALTLVTSSILQLNAMTLRSSDQFKDLIKSNARRIVALTSPSQIIQAIKTIEKKCDEINDNNFFVKHQLRLIEANF